MKRLASIKKNTIVIIHFFPAHCQTIHKANTTRSPFPEKFTKRTLFSQAKPRPCLPLDGAKRSFSLPRALRARYFFALCLLPDGVQDGSRRGLADLIRGIRDLTAR